MIWRDGSRSFRLVAGEAYWAARAALKGRVLSQRFDAGHDLSDRIAHGDHVQLPAAFLHANIVSDGREPNLGTR